MLVGVERGQSLAERLAGAVAGIRPHRLVHADATLPRIEADDMVRGCEHHPSDALATRGLEQVVATDDVGLQDGIPRSLDREPSEMDNAVDARDGALDLGQAGEVGRDEGFVRAKVGRPLDVA